MKMLTIKDLLKQLESLVTNNHIGGLKFFNYGLSIIQIDNAIKEFNIQFKEEMYDLYTWRNGAKNISDQQIGEMTFFRNGIFYPLENAIEVYDHNAIQNNTWRKEFFPLFSSGGGDFLLIDLDKKSHTNGMIMLYSPALLYTNEPNTAYDSLYSLLLTVLKCYEMKAYFFKNNMLEIDVDLEFDICKMNNPRSAYWQ